MAGSVNKVILIGRVGQDPETRKIGRGDDNEIAEFSLATSKSWRDRATGERKEKTQWHKVKIMNDGLVKGVVRPYVKKGTLLYVEGEVEYEQWEDRETREKKYATKIVVNPFGGQLHLVESNRQDDGGDRGSRRSDSGGSRSNDGGNRTGAGYGSGQSNFSRDLDDDIPF